MNRWNLSPLRQLAAVTFAASLALISACGGGGGADPGPTTTNPTQTATAYSQGAISGFGSIIVNGVRWDDSGATVTDDDGNSRSSAELKLGMVVEVEGADRSSTGGRALAIHYGSETLGPIASIDNLASTMVVLGQTVEVTSSTVFDASISGGLAGLAPGNVIEVHGLYDATAARMVATRVELRTAVTEYRVRGTVSALNSTAKTFKLGSESISYATAEVPSGFTIANNVQVKVRLQTTPVANVWTANKVRPIQRQLGLNRSEAEVEGVISAWTSATSFELNGLKVDASNASFPDGQTGVVLGAQVEVKGAVVEGVLVATSVHVEDEHHGGKETAREYELHGTISGLNPDAKTFALRGLTVSYAGNVTYKGGTQTQLANGARVEVKGTLSSDLTRIDATRIGFE